MGSYTFTISDTLKKRLKAGLNQPNDTSPRFLLVFDIDNTLIEALKPSELKRGPEVSMDHKLIHSTMLGYSIFLRPHVKEFMRFVDKYFTIVIWSHGDEEYVEYMSGILSYYFGLERNVVFKTYHRDHCEVSQKKYNDKAPKDLRYIIDDLNSQIGEPIFSIDRIAIVDDLDTTYQIQKDNCIFVSPFEYGNLDDDLFPKMQRLFESLLD